MKLIDKFTKTKFGYRYINDRRFRGNVGIYQGMAVNFIYAAFRAVTGLIYSSAWLLSSAAYFLLLGIMRLCLAYAYRKRRRKGGFLYEVRCYRRTAWLLFLLNIPAGVMILIMILSETGSSYPGYTIYASATYTFYMMTLSIINIVKYRKIGSPILSSAKVINFVAAMMSILGLQNALISEFSENSENFRMLMNTLTGAGIYIIIIATACYMIFHSSKIQKRQIK